MTPTEFETLKANDEFIVIRDIATGHVFTYPVVTNPLAEHVLGAGSFVANEMSMVRPEAIARRVWNYAQMQMHLAGSVDRVFIQ